MVDDGGETGANDSLMSEAPMTTPEERQQLQEGGDGSEETEDGELLDPDEVSTTPDERRQLRRPGGGDDDDGGDGGLQTPPPGEGGVTAPPMETIAPSGEITAREFEARASLPPGADEFGEVAMASDLAGAAGDEPDAVTAGGDGAAGLSTPPPGEGGVTAPPTAAEAADAARDRVTDAARRSAVAEQVFQRQRRLQRIEEDLRSGPSVGSIVIDGEVFTGDEALQEIERRQTETRETLSRLERMRERGVTEDGNIITQTPDVTGLPGDTFIAGRRVTGPPGGVDTLTFEERFERLSPVERVGAAVEGTFAGAEPGNVSEFGESSRFLTGSVLGAAGFEEAGAEARRIALEEFREDNPPLTEVTEVLTSLPAQAAVLGPAFGAVAGRGVTLAGQVGPRAGRAASAATTALGIGSVGLAGEQALSDIREGDIVGATATGAELGAFGVGALRGARAVSPEIGDISAQVADIGLRQEAGETFIGRGTGEVAVERNIPRLLRRDLEETLTGEVDVEAVQATPTQTLAGGRVTLEEPDGRVLADEPFAARARPAAVQEGPPGIRVEPDEVGEAGDVFRARGEAAVGAGRELTETRGRVLRREEIPGGVEIDVGGAIAAGEEGAVGVTTVRAFEERPFEFGAGTVSGQAGGGATGAADDGAEQVVDFVDEVTADIPSEQITGAAGIEIPEQAVRSAAEEATTKVPTTRIAAGTGMMAAGGDADAGVVVEPAREEFVRERPTRQPGRGVSPDVAPGLDVTADIISDVSVRPASDVDVQQEQFQEQEPGQRQPVEPLQFQPIRPAQQVGPPVATVPLLEQAQVQRQAQAQQVQPPVAPAPTPPPSRPGGFGFSLPGGEFADADAEFDRGMREVPRGVEREPLDILSATQVELGGGGAVFPEEPDVEAGPLTAVQPVGETEEETDLVSGVSAEVDIL